MNKSDKRSKEELREEIKSLKDMLPLGPVPLPVSISYTLIADKAGPRVGIGFPNREVYKEMIEQLLFSTSMLDSKEARQLILEVVIPDDKLAKVLEILQTVQTE